MLRSLLALLALLGSGPCMAASLFASDTPLDVELAGPLAKTLGDHSREPDYLPYTLRHAQHALSVQVRPRGSSRRAVCRFPPLRLQFEPSPAASVFDGTNKLKLVTHCNRRIQAEQNVLEEYAAYRILNLLTSASFRVRLMRMTYVDEERERRSSQSKWAFVIEDVEQVATRLGGRHVEPRGVQREDLDPEHAALTSMFQYLIGNTDYALRGRRPGQACCHNTKLIALGERLKSVPYDFDQAGLVDAAYAGPNPVYSGRDVRTRVYVGICAQPEALGDAIAALQAQREEIDSLIEQIPGMTEKTRRRSQSYIDKFYARMANRDVKTLLRHCR